MSRFCSLAALVGALLLGLSGCANDAGPSAGNAADKSANGGARKRIVVLMNGNSPFWDAVGVGIREAEKELDLAAAGLSAALETNNATPQGQIEKLRQFASQSDIAAVGISAVDAANPGVIDQMKRLRDQGVHVVTIDSDVDSANFPEARFAFIGSNNPAAGRELGIAAKAMRPDGGSYVTFVGRTSAQNAVERIGGFGEGAGEKFKALDAMSDANDRSKSQQNVRDAMTNHPELNVLVGIWSYNAPAIVDVVREKQARDKYTIVVFDAEPKTIEYMQEGDVDAMIVQNPFQMGYQGVRLMKALATGDEATVKELFPNHGQPGGDVYDTGLKLVVPSAESPLKRELFGEKTEFLTLDVFREWLAKYGLVGS